MQRIYLTSFCLVAFLTAHGVRADERPALSALPRYDEDYRFLADPAKRTDFLDLIKYIPLGNAPPTYLSFGGELRERYEGFLKNPLFGLNGLHSDNYVLHRLLLSADLHVTESFRSFIQLGDHDVYGKRGTVTSTERSGFDIQQAFAEGNLLLADKEILTMRVGRQEMLLGSQRLVGVREGPNIRQSFDEVRGIYSAGPYNLTAFVGRPVLIRPNDFDDISDHSQLFWGIYSVIPVSGNAHADLYFLKLDRDNAKFAQGTANERRSSVGMRLWDAKATLDYNFEFVYQFGSFGSGDIKAWTVASDTGYTVKDTPWTPRIGLKADVASGDKDRNNPNLNTFNALFPKGSYFTENALIGPANFIDLQPNITVKPGKDITLTTGVDILWRENTNDAIYRQPNIAIAGTAGNPSRYTGSQAFILGTWYFDSHASITATYVHFDVGNAIKAAGGGDNEYLGMWVTYRF